MRFIAPALALLVTGCAFTPEQMVERSNYDVCRFTLGGPHARVAESEAQRRGLDCAPLYPAIAAREGAKNQAMQNAQKAFAPAPMTRCTSTNVGGYVTTTCQ